MLSTTNSLALSLIREAAVSTPCAEKECAIVKALCDSSLLEARELLRMYMEKVKTSQFYLQTLEYLLDHNPTLFTYALDLSRGGWHRRYKDRKYLVRGSLENVKTLQKHLLDEKVSIRVLFTYAVSYNIALQPEILEVVHTRALKEAEKSGVSLEELMDVKNVSYAAIYAYQLREMDRMRRKRA